MTNQLTDQEPQNQGADDKRWAEFLDRLVHDLREPFRSIGVFSELLVEMARGHTGEEGETVLREILSGVSRAGSLLDGVSAYSMSLREDFGIGRQATSSLQSAFKIVMANLDRQIQACGAQVSGIAVPEGVQPPRLGISLERLLQLLENLIGNSLRFQSGVPPAIRLSAAPADEGMWTLRVEDNGAGIAPENLEAIFKPFMRVEGKKYPGAGLGLSICKKIVEAHGGTIRMESTPGEGSVCILTLPEA